jgi:hypothetical protein
MHDLIKQRAEAVERGDFETVARIDFALLNGLFMDL